MENLVNEKDIDFLLKSLSEYDNGPNKKLTVVTDMDEVLVDIAPKWVNSMVNNKKLFDRVFNLDMELSNEIIHNREDYYINKWLLRNDVEEVPFAIYELFMSLYEVSDFYEDLKPTTFCKNLSDFSTSNNCEKIYILSDTIEQHIDSKYKWVMENFKDTSKIFFVPCRIGKDCKGKSDIIKRENINYSAFIDDKLENIIDVMENTSSFNKEFMIPTKGYNSNSDAKILLGSTMEDKFVSVNYYK